ncbi:Transmembrane osmosensor [Rhodosporidiobolus nylandii]
MPRGGFDVRPVLSHPGFLLTLLIASAGWWAAFIGQIVLESKYHSQGNSGSAVGVPWFGIFLQLFLNIGVFVTLATDSVGANRFQLSVFLAVALVMAVIGTNSGIFQDTSFQLAIGAGWLLIAAVDILWILYFTSSDDAWFASVFDIGSSIHFSSRSSVNGTLSRRLGPSGRNGSSLGMAGPAGGATYQSYQGVGGMKSAGGPGSVGGSHHGGPASMSVQDLQMEQQTSPAGGAQSMLGEQGVAPEYAGTVLKARALYSYSASPDDPNEISFAKGEILDVLDNSGKWWQTRKSDGSRGIAPSN